MKKFARIILMLVLLISCSFSLFGCEDSSKEDQKGITCKIKFAEEVDEEYNVLKWYDTNEFKINTKIYVIFDFTMTNSDKTHDDVVDFQIRIPNAKYYSMYEYKKGPIKPSNDDAPYEEVINPDGSTTKNILLKGMKFSVKKGSIPFNYIYCICIEANMPCQDAVIKAVYSSEGYVCKNTTVYDETYSFIDNVEVEVENENK